jgi:uncharacterized protein with FMN-binding domain
MYMKKVLIGFGVLVIFILYSLWVRHDQPKVGTIVSTTSPASNSSSEPTNNSSSNSNTSTGTNTASSYKDGTYTGDSADASYGNVQVAAVISGGKLSDVTVLQYPDTHSDSVAINQTALPLLKQEAIQSQNPNNIQIISGATFTSEAFVQSLTSALNQAQNT